MLKRFTTLLFSVLFAGSSVFSARNYNSILTGISWYTQYGDHVSAHGANIVKEGDKFYLFGEYKNNENNRFEGFSCYSSSDLTNWKFEGFALSRSQAGRLSGPESIGERPKVMKCPSTGEFIMYLHADSNNYKNPAVEYAVAKKITGPYLYKGQLKFGNEYIKRWDMGTFQDDDGTGYIVMHHGDIYKLANDYKSVVEHTLHDKTLNTESPAVFKRNGTYYWVGSGLTGWERNDNRYFTAKSLSGPWSYRGTVAPEGTLTWNSQSTFVFPVTGSKTTTFIYMGDRWSFPKQRATATYVWQPLIFNGDEISMPIYHESWAVDVATGEWNDVPLKPVYELSCEDSTMRFEGPWEQVLVNNSSSRRARLSNAKVSFKFTGKKVAIRGIASADCGYGHITITNSKGKIMHETWVDMYSGQTVEGLQYLSPVLVKGTYSVTFSPAQTHWYWIEKSGKVWGSKDTFISFSKALVF